MTTVSEEFSMQERGYLEIMDVDGATPVRTILCDVGFQAVSDGRVWLCIDGKAFIRFKPVIPRKRKKGE